MVKIGGKNMIEIKNATKKYGNNIALQDVSFTINDGEIFNCLTPSYS